MFKKLNNYIYITDYSSLKAYILNNLKLEKICPYVFHNFVLSNDNYMKSININKIPTML